MRCNDSADIPGIKFKKLKTYGGDKKGRGKKKYGKKKGKKGHKSAFKGKKNPKK